MRPRPPLLATKLVAQNTNQMFILHSKRNWNWFLCKSYACSEYGRATYGRLSCVIPRKSSQTDKLTTTSPVDIHKTCATPCEIWLIKYQMQHIKYSEKIFFFSYYSHNYWDMGQEGEPFMWRGSKLSQLRRKLWPED